MPDMRKVNSGDALSYSANTHNRFIDAALYVESLKDSRGRLPKLDARMDGICYVKNASGSDKPRYSALGIDSPLFNPRTFFNAFTQGITLKGVTPDSSLHSGKFVILAEPLKDGEVGLAWSSGICPALLDPDTATGATHADIIDGETSQLAGGGRGAPIVWLDDTNDGYDRWALIHLATFGGGDVLLKLTGSSPIGPKNSGGILFESTAEILDHLVTGATAPDPLLTVTVSGLFCQGIILPGQPFWARGAGGKYWAKSGSMFLEGTAAADIAAGAAGDITLSDDGITTCTVQAIARCDDPIVSGQRVGIGVRPFIGGSPNQTQLRVIWECCADIETPGT